MAYQLYWAPTLGDTLRPVEIFSDPTQLTYTWNELGERRTIAGCFAVTALDSLQPGPDGTLRRNESALSDTLCADNCPFYFLPNVFTPNLDQVNDAFQRFHGNSSMRWTCASTTDWVKKCTRQAIPM